MSDLKPFDNEEASHKLNIAELQKIKDSEILTVPERKAALTRAMPKVIGRWNELQSILIDVEVGFRIRVLANSMDKMPSTPDMIEQLTKEVELRYIDQPESKDLLLFNIPSRQAAHKWMARPEWKEEVEKRLKDNNLFSLEKRSAMIESLYNSGFKLGNMKAAEMWLKMSGDLSNQPQVKDKALDSFKQLSESLYNNNGKE